MRVLGKVLATLLSVYLMVATFTYLGGRLQAQASAAPTPASSVSFTGQGALTYFREGDGHIDTYFIYRAPDGSVATKILSFNGQSVCGNQSCPDPSIALYFLYGTYGAGPVLVTGTVENEELSVTSIAATGDVPGSLQVLSLQKEGSVSFGGFSLKVLTVEPEGIEVAMSNATSSDEFFLTPGTIVDSHHDWYMSYAALPDGNYAAPFLITVIRKN